MIRTLAIWSVLLALPLTAWFANPSHAETITRDYGGNNWDYMVRVVGADSVRIVGVCESACVMFLGAQNVCVAPDAVLGFHASYDPSTGEINRAGAEMVAAFLPPKIAAWFLSGPSLSKDMTRVTGQALHDFDPSVRLC